MADEGAAAGGIKGTLDGLEELLRMSVHDALAAKSEDWWDKLVPADVRGRAKKIFQQRLSRGGRPGSMAECLAFSDYQKIIDANWDGVFRGIFKDHDLVRWRLQELTAIRNKIAHSGAVTCNERRGFEYHAEEIKTALLKNAPDHETAAAYLGALDRKMEDAYRGAVRAMHQDGYPDQPVQFAHSLREVIDLLARRGQKKGGMDCRQGGGRALAIQNAVDPHGGSPLGDDYALLEDMYERLSAVAHHRTKITVPDGLKMLRDACAVLSRIARPQLEVDDEVDRVIEGGPSGPAAKRLVRLLDREVTRNRAAPLLGPEWLPHLIRAGLFTEPSAGAAGASGAVRIARPMSAYLPRCAPAYPREVSRLVLGCPAGGAQSTGARHYPDLLRCAAAFGPDIMEKIAKKALDEGWPSIVVSCGLVEPLAALAEGLFRHKRYGAGAALAYDGLRPAQGPRAAGEPGPAAPRRGAVPYPGLFKSDLREIVRRIAPLCPEEAVGLLARLLEAHAGAAGRPAWPVPGLVASIEDSDQNIGGPVGDIVLELRDALERIGADSPCQLRRTMPLLYRRSGMLFRRLELHVYRLFPREFAGEISTSLRLYFGVAEAHHEHYLLLRDSFSMLSERDRDSFCAFVDRACAGGDGYTGGDGGADPESALLAHGKFLFLHAIHPYLGGRHAEEYSRLRGMFGEPPHPDYLRYAEAFAGGGEEPAEPKGPAGPGDADSVMREAASSGPPPGQPGGRGDAAAERLEEYVSMWPAECAPRSGLLKDARPAIQCAFFAGMEAALQKKRLPGLPDLSALAMHIIEQERSDPGRRDGYGRWDPLRQMCWLLDASFKADAVGRDLAEGVEEIILALVDAGTRRGESDCDEYGQHALMGAINGVNGLSFMLLFRHWMWRWKTGGGSGGERFDPVLRGIIDAYMDGGAAARTSCRHSVIGLFAVAIHQKQPELLRRILKRLDRTKKKASFWAAYVTNNRLREDTFGAMWKHYDMFLNGRLLYNLGLAGAIDATFQHVALAYLYDLEHADGIFEGFVKKARMDAVRRAVMPLALIMRGKKNDAGINLEKVAGLWKEGRFGQLDLSAWFLHTPLDRRAAIGLYMDYLGRYEGRMDAIGAPVEELGAYADEFPREAASCLLLMVEKGTFVDVRAVGAIVERLEARGGSPAAAEACRRIREALAKRGLDLGEDK